MPHPEYAHLSFGSLLAAAVTGKPDADARKHIEECRDCVAIYERYLRFVREQVKPDFQECLQKLSVEKCLQKEIGRDECANYFLAFQSKDHDADHSKDFVSHINDCYSCLESFSVNWNEFLTRVSKIK